VHVDTLPLETPFVETEPVIVLPYGTMNILIEGYFRSTLFMRSGTSRNSVHFAIVS
jgi:hypothetical protein